MLFCSAYLVSAFCTRLSSSGSLKVLSLRLPKTNPFIPHDCFMVVCIQSSMHIMYTLCTRSWFAWPRSSKTHLRCNYLRKMGINAILQCVSCLCFLYSLVKLGLFEGFEPSVAKNKPFHSTWLLYGRLHPVVDAHYVHVMYTFVICLTSNTKSRSKRHPHTSPLLLLWYVHICDVTASSM